jgi:hypothetical protein
LLLGGVDRDIKVFLQKLFVDTLHPVCQNHKVVQRIGYLSVNDNIDRAFYNRKQKFDSGHFELIVELKLGFGSKSS